MIDAWNWRVYSSWLVPRYSSLDGRKKNFRFLDAEIWKEGLERGGLGRCKDPRARNPGKKQKKQTNAFSKLCSPGGACMRAVGKKISEWMLRGNWFDRGLAGLTHEWRMPIVLRGPVACANFRNVTDRWDRVSDASRTARTPVAKDSARVTAERVPTLSLVSRTGHRPSDNHYQRDPKSHALLRGLWYISQSQ